jgi:polysaccharide pyruvyl transferase WcaK-like protein
MITRRKFLGGIVSAATIATQFPTLPLRAAAPKRKPRVLLRSSWQVVNIGDIAHTPGVLALIEEHIPEAEVILWASGDFSPEVAAMEQKRFPKLKIVKGALDADGKASNPSLGEAVEWADFLLHGSGPALVGAKDVAAFVKHTGKPFGVYGITHGSFLSGDDNALLAKAKFIFFRDSVSLERAKREGIKSPILEFAPDGAFACDLRDDAKADAFLKSNGLEPGKFLCCLSRLRYTPYWLVRAGATKDEKRHARNAAMKEHDHKPIRDAIIAVAQQTSLKVLLCPEDSTQMTVGREMFWDKLPADVKERVVWREKFWLTDEALSTYVRSAGLFGSEMHSPIMAVGNGVPAIVCRFEEQTSKGIMWRDIGLGEWLFDLDKPDEHAGVVPATLSIARDPAAAKAKVAKAMTFVKERQRESMAIVRAHL